MSNLYVHVLSIDASASEPTPLPAAKKSKGKGKGRHRGIRDPNLPPLCLETGCFKPPTAADNAAFLKHFKQKPKQT